MGNERDLTDPAKPEETDSLEARVAAALERGEALRRQRCYDEAARILSDALEHRIDRAAIHYRLGNVHVDRGDLAGAEMAYRRALDADPHHANALNNLAVVYKRQNRIGLYVKTYKRALREFSKAPNARRAVTTNGRRPALGRTARVVLGVCLAIAVIILTLRAVVY